MYEEECLKLKKIEQENRNLKLENSILKYELEYKNKSLEKKIKSEIEKAISPLIEENCKLNNKLNDAYEEIDRLKSQISTNENKDYKIDKLTNQVNKDSTNSGIPTSKEIGKKKQESIHIIKEQQVLIKLEVRLVIKEKL